MTSLTYAQAVKIATGLINKQTKPATLLSDLVKKTGRQPTFLIMRHGDPANWRAAPSQRKKRAASAILPKLTPWGKEPLEGPFALRHLKTGRTVTAKTVKELAKKAKIPSDNTSIVNLDHVCAGRHHSAHGWYRKEVLDAKVTLKDQFGNEYPTLSVRDLSLKHGISPSTAINLSTGRRAFFKGLTLASTPIHSVLRPRNWRFTEVAVKRDGATIKAKSIPALADKLGVSPSDLYQMAYGFKTREDMEFINIEIEKKAILPSLA